MFRHQGKSRTLKHNLQIAMVLSLVAGLVNVTGFMEIHQLTTNVTGHFAFFIYDMANLDFANGTVNLFYILAFLFGSFISGAAIELAGHSKRLNIFAVPAALEAAILLGVALFMDLRWLTSAGVIACLLLFAMGLQNSFVTKISNAVVRTTHLTGLFTDLGIELAQLAFSQKHNSSIRSTVKLRIYIVSFFFIGGVIGGMLFLRIGINALILGSLLLLSGLLYDDLRYRLITARRRYVTR